MIGRTGFWERSKILWKCKYNLLTSKFVWLASFFLKLWLKFVLLFKISNLYCYTSTHLHGVHSTELLSLIKPHPKFHPNRWVWQNHNHKSIWPITIHPNHTLTSCNIANHLLYPSMAQFFLSVSFIGFINLQSMLGLRLPLDEGFARTQVPPPPKFWLACWPF